LRSEPPAASKSILAPATTLWNRFRTLTGFNLIGLFADSRAGLPAGGRSSYRSLRFGPLDDYLIGLDILKLDGKLF
jgi:hypothetical protein